MMPAGKPVLQAGFIETAYQADTEQGEEPASETFVPSAVKNISAFSAVNPFSSVTLDLLGFSAKLLTFQ